MKKALTIICLMAFSKAHSQELYVFTEPASNMPAHSISVKLSDRFATQSNTTGKFSHRLMPQLMFGFSKNFMLHLGGTFSNMHTPDFRFESLNLYAKYRILSKDEIHRHFRMAAFLNGTASSSPFHYDEINLMGDKGGIEAGIIATQLWNKFALSATVSHTQVLHKSRNDKVIYVPERGYQGMSYSLSGGLLVLPKDYTDYKQTNLNLYAEVLAGQTLDINKYFRDLAPAVQLIFNSNAKLNLGYRFQLSGNMSRMTNQSWLISFERTFLSVMK
jgi:hypothetical protein